MQKIVKIKIARYIINFVFFTIIFIGLAYYYYTSSPGLFSVKDLLLPFKNMMIACILLAALLTALNEIITYSLVRTMGVE